MSLAPGQIIDAVAVFPLPGVVLFPGTLLPLHVFEPRYRKMTEDVLASNRLLCMAFLARDASGDAPPLPAVAGLGEIVRQQRLADGRYNLLLLGRCRVALDELDFVAPYRRARATVLRELPTTATERDVAALLSAAARAGGPGTNSPSVPLDGEEAPSPSGIADRVASALVADGTARQALLEELDVAARVRGCAQALALQSVLTSPSSFVN